ncbi:MAG: hypothetical protein K1X67_11085 [Fimbriimonadaceae bacterium]|nr:hypothetical protein [Fimbriimonadaceae bacterium]
MDPSQHSSLDRFIWDRGSILSGANVGPRGGLLAVSVNSVVQGAMALTFFGLATFLQKGNIGFIIGGVTCGITSVVLGGVALAWRRRLSREVKPQVKLRPEGQQLMMRLMQHIGWYGPSQTQGLSGFGWKREQRTCSQVIHPVAFELLEAATFQYNRLNGLMRIEGSSLGSPAIEQLGPSIQTAMTDAIVSIFNQVGVLQKVPESSAAIRTNVESEIQTLRELADRVESLRNSMPTLTDQLSGGSSIRTVLEQLRMEEVARGELHRATQDEVTPPQTQ